MVQLLAAISQVVVTGDLHAGGRKWLEVGRDDVAARRVFFLRVGAEGVKAQFVGLLSAAIEDVVRVDPFRANRQLRGSPPADITFGIGPDDVQSRCLNFLCRGAHFIQRVGAVYFVEAFQDRILGL